jgi:hypothetical protein
MGRLVLSSLPSQEFIGPDYEDGRVACHIYADSIELHVFRSTEEVVPPLDYEVVT